MHCKKRGYKTFQGLNQAILNSALINALQSWLEVLDNLRPISALTDSCGAIWDVRDSALGTVRGIRGKEQC